jgi:hypothetical protein
MDFRAIPHSIAVGFDLNMFAITEARRKFTQALRGSKRVGLNYANAIDGTAPVNLEQMLVDVNVPLILTDVECITVSDVREVNADPRREDEFKFIVSFPLKQCVGELLWVDFHGSYLVCGH